MLFSNYSGPFLKQTTTNKTSRSCSSQRRDGNPEPRLEGAQKPTAEAPRGGDSPSHNPLLWHR